jgi:hypothetical protein
MDYDKLIEKATGGMDTICSDAMPASGIRPLIFDDAGLLWLEHHGEAEEGFKRDGGRYKLLPFLGKLGNEFEAAYIRNEAPEAKRLLEHDWEVRKSVAFEKTLDHLKKKTQFMWKAALWWTPAQIYGVADAIVHTSWLYKRYPHLKPAQREADHFVIIDFKFSQKLETTAKRADLEHATNQVRIYSYILGHLQDHMPARGYVISRDTVDAPIVVDIDLELNQPLDEELTDLRTAYLDIKVRGSDLRPWTDRQVALNPSNKQDEPWHDAKTEILKERVKPKSLLMLPGVGPETARKMRLHGYKNIDDLLKRNIDRLKFEEVEGIYPAMAERLRAVLKANKTGEASPIPTDLVPRRMDIEIHIDTEYFSNLNVDFDKDWPLLSGTPIIFMIGCRYKESGEWKFKRFTVAEESFAAEEVMLRKFLAFLRQKGVFDPSKQVALYCWSNAEASACRQAAQRHDFPQLDNLPFIDLLKVFKDGPIALPGMWSFGLKEVAEALGDYAPHYRVEWPDGLDSGQNAQIAAWTAFDADEPLKTPEMRLIAEYLEQDTTALDRILAWLRNSVKSQNRKEASWNGWYRNATNTGIVEVGLSGQTGVWYRRSRSSP